MAVSLPVVNPAPPIFGSVGTGNILVALDCIFFGFRYDGDMFESGDRIVSPLGLIVLAGGDGRRMRKNKARLPVPGGTLIERILNQLRGLFAETLVSVSEAAGFDFLPERKIEDPVPGQGPMRGLHTALTSARFDGNFVIACDIPDIDLPFLRSLLEASHGQSITIAAQPDGLPEPLFGVYHRSTCPEMERLLNLGFRSLLALHKKHPPRLVPLPLSARWMKNLNSPEDYRRFLNNA